MKRGLGTLGSGLAAIVASGIVGALVAAAPAAAQSPVTIRGRVVAADNGASLPRARVAVTGVTPSRPAVLTAATGEFTLTLPATIAEVTLTVGKGAFAPAVLTLDRKALAGAAANGLEIPLEQSGAIVGRVVDGRGEPEVASRVSAQRIDIERPPRPIVTQTNDLGEYRLGALPAGRYTLAFDERLLSTHTRTTEVEVRPGDDVAIDFASGVTRVGYPPMAISPLPAPRGATGSIRGRVVGADGQSLRAAVRVEQSGSDRVVGVLTDDEGRFDVKRLPAGAFTVEASVEGYLPARYGQRRATDAPRPVRLTAGQTVDGIEIQLHRPSAITGVIVDDVGEPLPGATVKAVQLRYVDGRLQATRSHHPPIPQTDDRGRYRIYGLPPGRYYVTATMDGEVLLPEDDTPYAYGEVFYPGTALVGEAAHVAVEAGRDSVGVDFALPPSRRPAVRGRAVNTRGFPVRNVTLRVSSRSSAIDTAPRVAEIEGDGSFVIRNVPPGTYVVHALTDPGPSQEFAWQTIIVADRDPPALALETAPGSSVSGTIQVLDGRVSNVPSNPIVAVAVDPDRAPVTSARAETPAAPGLLLTRFALAPLFGQQTFVPRLLSDDWYLKSVVIGGRDVVDNWYEFGTGGASIDNVNVVISFKAAAISGRAAPRRDRQAPGGDAGTSTVLDYAVVVFSAERRRWEAHSRYLRHARAAHDGSYRVGGLPPGNYLVAAVPPGDEAFDGGAWQNREVLERLSRGAERVRLTEGEQATVSLTIVEPR